MRVTSALAAIVVLLGGCGGGDEPAAIPTFEQGAAAVPDVAFTIPAGTNEQAAAGADPQIFPNPLVLQVGDVIRITNDDAIGYDIGPFYVAANETMTATVLTEGERSSFCSLHPSGSITVIVEAA